MKRRTIIRTGGICACALAILCGSSFAYYTAEGGGSARADVTSLTEPTFKKAEPATGGTVKLEWNEISPPTGATGTVTYYITRENGQVAASCPDVNSPKAVTECTDSGLNPGTYKYQVVAVWNRWTRASAVKSVTVTVGTVTKFTITGSSTPSTGAGPNLTITAVDSAGKTVTNFTGSHDLVFSGASPSAEGKAPTVANASGTAIPFGEPTTLTFGSGTLTAASSKNGYVQIYKPGEAKITATEGSLTTPTPLTVNVLPTAAKFVLTDSSTTVAAGTATSLTIKAYDNYGNLSTNYTGSKNLTFSGAATSPGGNAPTVENSSGTPVAFGTATAVAFSAGVAAVTEGKNGEMILYASGSPTVKATEGSINGTVAMTVTPLATTTFALTSSSINFATTTAPNLTVTARDVYGNTTPSYTGAKTLTFNASGTATETSPGGSVPGVYNSSGTLIPFGSATAITFTNGTVTGASSKNGTLRLFKPGTASLTVTDSSYSSPALALTVTTGAAKRLAVTEITASPGTISSPCYLTCSVTGLGNSGTGSSGTVSAALTITDEYGNPISNIGASKTVTVTSTSGSTVTGSPLTVPESGTATTTTKFTYTAPSNGNYTNTIAAASTGYTGVSITTSK